MTVTRSEFRRAIVFGVLALVMSDARVDAAFNANQSGNISSEQIREASQNVMQQPDYRAVRRRILENIVEDRAESSGDGFLQQSLRAMGVAIGDFLDWIFTGIFSSGPGPRPAPTPTPTPAPAPSSGGSMDFSVGKVLLFVSMAALLLTLVWIFSAILKASDGRRKIDKQGLFGDDEEDLSNLSVPPGELAASTYESRALKSAQDGNYRSAIRELLLGSMSWIERAGMIRFRKGLTNRDYILAVWREEERRFAFGRTALQFERVYFGRREATREMFDNCLQAFQGAFREESTTQTL